MASIKQEATRCLKCKKAQCSLHCPVSTDVPQVCDHYSQVAGLGISDRDHADHDDALHDASAQPGLHGSDQGEEGHGYRRH